MSRARGHVRREIEAWNTGSVASVEWDVGGTGLPRDISRDNERGIGVAVQACTRIIDVVSHCLRIADPSQCGITCQWLSQTR